MSEAREILNVDQAAEFLGVSTRSLYEAIGRLEVPHRRIGRRIVLSRRALLAWLDSCEAPPRNGY